MLTRNFATGLTIMSPISSFTSFLYRSYAYIYYFFLEKNCSNFWIVTTQVVFLYRVLLSIANYSEQNLAIWNRLYRVKYFCYSEQVTQSRIFLGYTEHNIFAIQFTINHANTSTSNIQFSKLCLHLLALFLIKDYVSY